MGLEVKDLISIHDLSTADVNQILELAATLKAQLKNGEEHHLLKGKTLGMIFQKSSTRTRVSFEVGMWQLGGSALFLSANDLQIGRGEPVKDTARVLSRYVDGIMIRTSSHDEVIEMAALVKKDQKELLAAVDEALEKLKAAGTLTEISNKYFDKDISQESK